MMAYLQYKKTNLAWLEEIPIEWEYGGLTKYLDSIVDYRGKTPEKVEDGVFLITAKNIKQGKIDYSLSKEFVKLEEYEEIMRRGLPEIGDVLFTTEAPLGEVANVDRVDIALAQRVIKFQGIEDVLDNYYLKYWIQSHGFQSNLKTFATGSTAAGIKASKLSSLQVLLPSYSEQKKIVLFLDNKIEEIDGLITQKEKMIKLLEEKRQSMITEAVTKGLNPNVKMKDSGVEWIGEIPEHWEVKKFKRCFKVVNGKEINVELDVEDQNGVDVFGSGGKFKKTNEYLYSGESVLFGRKGTIGKPLYVSGEFWVVDTMYFTKFYRDSYPKWFYYVLKRYPWHLIMTQTALPSIVGSDIENDQWCIPTYKEQKEISSYLDEVSENIDNLISDINTQIENLKEYRQSLIYEVVTGKIDVRDFEVKA